MWIHAEFYVLGIGSPVGLSKEIVLKVVLNDSLGVRFHVFLDSPLLLDSRQNPYQNDGF